MQLHACLQWSTEQHQDSGNGLSASTGGNSVWSSATETWYHQMCCQWCSTSLVKALVQHRALRVTACLKVENQPRDISQCSTGTSGTPQHHCSRHRRGLGFSGMRQKLLLSTEFRNIPIFHPARQRPYNTTAMLGKSKRNNNNILLIGAY